MGRPSRSVWAGAGRANPAGRFSTNTSCKRGFYFSTSGKPGGESEKVQFQSPFAVWNSTVSTRFSTFACRSGPERGLRFVFFKMESCPFSRPKSGRLCRKCRHLPAGCDILLKIRCKNLKRRRLLVVPRRKRPGPGRDLPVRAVLPLAAGAQTAEALLQKVPPTASTLPASSTAM